MKNNITKINKDQCVGCSSCFQICKENAIDMLANKDGFLIPKLNSNKCINCGLCIKVCPINNSNNTNSNNKTHVYASYSKDSFTVMNSSSGGLFTEIAKYIINKRNGVVFGAMFDENYNVLHNFVDNVADLSKIRGSKYVQSNINQTYKKVRDFLNKNIVVYFTGTPCQVAGLLLFLGKEYDNLYTQDLVCHGVPSPLVWQSYLKEKKKNIISKISFRNKKNGWYRYSLRIDYTNGIAYSKEVSDDKYYTSFLRNWDLRKSCYNCKFKGIDRVSDITLADYWGVEKEQIHYNVNGTSLVLTHSKKGEELLELIKSNIYTEKVDNLEYYKNNPSIIESIERPFERLYFIRLNSIGFSKAYNITNNIAKIKTLILKYISIIKHRLRKLLKK